MAIHWVASRSPMQITKIMLEIAGTHASGRLVSVLEGGYDLEGLEAAVGEHLKVLAAS
jgi:acetoin utilization deacetylase AcuC-like enzyme